MDNLSAQPPSTMAENCPDIKSDASRVLSVVRQWLFIKCECTIEVLHSTTSYHLEMCIPFFLRKPGFP